jgi:uncharacterized protein with HEPN domain
MKKNNLVYLKQIMDYIDKIERYVSGISFEDFEKNGLLQDGVMRNIELIGDTARKLSPLFWEKYRNVLPLAEAVSMRNKLIHEYADSIWNCVEYGKD